MNLVARILTIALLFGFTGFCVFGFLASAEYQGVQKLMWQITYALAGLAALVGIFTAAQSKPEQRD